MHIETFNDTIKSVCFDFGATNVGSSVIKTSRSEGSLLPYFYRFWCHYPLITYVNINLQLNEYELDPYFLQPSLNMITDYFFPSVLSPEFTWFEHKIVLFWFQNNFMLKSGKFRGKHRSKQSVHTDLFSKNRFQFQLILPT